VKKGGTVLGWWGVGAYGGSSWEEVGIFLPCRFQQEPGRHNTKATRWRVDFFGEHERTLDGKGRLVLPSKFRSKLPDGGFLTPTVQGIALYDQTAWRATIERLTARVRSGEVAPGVLQYLSASAEEVSPDAAGRIVLPPRLRVDAAISTEVMVLGMSDHLEIWDKARWETQRSDLAGQAMQALAQGFGI
jgi:MraZ protein